MIRNWFESNWNINRLWDGNSKSWTERNTNCNPICPEIYKSELKWTEQRLESVVKLQIWTEMSKHKQKREKGRGAAELNSAKYQLNKTFIQCRTSRHNGLCNRTEDTALTDPLVSEAWVGCRRRPLSHPENNFIIKRLNLLWKKGKTYKSDRTVTELHQNLSFDTCTSCVLF